MSTLSFVFGEGETVDVRGAERHYLDFIVNNAAFGAAGLPDAFQPGRLIHDRFGPFLPQEWLARHPATSEDTAHCFVRDLRFDRHEEHGQKSFLSWKGKSMQSFSLLLNTAIVFGSDPVALAAKLHGACELHLRIEGKDRGWLADVIEQGLNTNILRKGFWSPRNPYADLAKVMGKEVSEEQAEPVFRSMGWDKLIEQLRTDDQHPVVTEYSVTGGFMDRPEDWVPEGPLRAPESDWETLADIKDEAFGELPWEERFALSYAELSRKNSNLPISSATLRCETFRHELTLLDLAAGDIEKIERALGVEPGE